MENDLGSDIIDQEIDVCMQGTFWAAFILKTDLGHLR